MDSEFFALQLSRDELMELHAAMAQRIMVEDTAREEKGLEPVARRPLMDRLDDLLALSDAEEESVGRRLDDELWEYAWFAFTDEWAWHRATQAVEREVGVKNGGAAMKPTELRHRIEERYRKDFDLYVQELEMGGTRDASKISGR